MKNLSNRLHLLLPLTVAACAFLPALSPQSAPLISIAYVDCPQNLSRYSEPRLTAFDEHGVIVAVRSFPRTNGTSIREVDVSLAPGFYDVIVANRDCSDDLLVSALPGHNRHLVAIGRSEAVLRPKRGMLAGSLPFEGAGAAIVYRGRVPAQGQMASPDGYLQVPAVVDGNAYYAVGLPNGNATVRLYNLGHYRWLDFDGGSIDASKGSINLIRNISSEDIAERLRTLARGGPICAPGRAPGVTICTPPR